MPAAFDQGRNYGSEPAERGLRQFETMDGRPKRYPGADEVADPFAEEMSAVSSHYFLPG